MFKTALNARLISRRNIEKAAKNADLRRIYGIYVIYLYKICLIFLEDALCILSIEVLGLRH